MENCGIHAIAINPSGTRMVTGGANPSDCAVFSVPDLRPTALLTGHKDWVFGLDWITDNIVASGSRDKTVKLWCVPDAPCDITSVGAGSYRQLSAPINTIDAHGDRVRDLRYCHDIKRLASMSTDGRILFLDPETTTVEQRRLRGKKELVCLATDGKLLVAGSQQHISILDHRVGTPVRDERLVDNSVDGVRSLSFNGGGRLLTCGGGGGKMTFFDLRAGQFLPTEAVAGHSRDLIPFHRVVGDDGKDIGMSAAPEDTLGEAQHSPSTSSPSSSSPMRMSSSDDSDTEFLSFQMGEGYLDRQHYIYQDHFSDSPVLNACYAHAWDASGTRLLVAGGPLAYGLRGCYVGVWR